MIGLSAFFAAVVAAGSATFSAACPDDVVLRGTAPTDFFQRSIRRAKTNVRKVRSALDGLIAKNPGPLPEGVLAIDGGDDGSEEEAALARLLGPRREVVKPVLDFSLSGEPRVEPLRMSDRDLWGCTSCELLPALLRSPSHPWWVELGDGLFTLPETFFDGAIDIGRSIFPSDESVSIRRQAEGPIIPRIFALQLGTDLEAPFATALDRWVAQEQAYYAGFRDNPIASFMVEEGLSEPDHDDLVEDQRRIALDALRKTYLGKYVVRVEERVRDEAYQFGQWRGVDFLLGPPVILAYTYVRGFDRRVKLGDHLRLRIHLEPLRRLQDVRGDDEDDLVGALGFELGFENFPVKAILSFGYHNGHAELDFVGIGTSLGEARKAVRMILDIEEPKD